MQVQVGSSRLLLSANLIPKRQLMGSASKIVSYAPSVLVPKSPKSPKSPQVY